MVVVIVTVTMLIDDGDEGGDVSAHRIDMLSNGFRLKNSDSKGNGSGDTYVFFAFAEAPFKNSRAR